jgi:hypothetical protein
MVTGLPSCHRATPPAHAGRSSDSRWRRASLRHRCSLFGIVVFAGEIPVLQVLETCLGRWRISPTRTKGLVHCENGQRGVGDRTADMHDGRDTWLALEQALEARDPKGWFMPDQRGGQQVHGLAEVWTADFGHVRGRMHRGPRMTWAGGTPRRGPQCAPRRKAIPLFDRRQHVGHERR